MARLLLLVVFFVWMAWGEIAPPITIVSPLIGSGLFLAFFAAIVLCMGIWGRRVADRLPRVENPRDISRFHLGLDVARILICIWFAAGVIALGWTRIVEIAVGPFTRWGIHLPGLILGAAPALLAWAGLWWAQYPVDRALRELDLEPRLSQQAGPIARAGPSFRTYFQLQVRMQILMTVAPLVLVLGVHDLLVLAVHLLPIRMNSDWLELGYTVVSLAAVLIWGPELLRRVVKTRPLSQGPLRRRLVALAERCHIGYRDILLWDTGNQVANAMVMGLRANLRYVMISDLLIETLSDQQIEAVFAHELGHVRHRHLMRLALFMGLLLLIMMGPATTIRNLLGRAGFGDGWWLDITLWIVCGGAFFACFGYVLRRFERQADLFAARTLIGRQVAVMPPATPMPSRVSRSAAVGIPLAALAAALFESPSGFPAGALALTDSGDFSDPGQVLFSESSMSIDVLPSSGGVITQSGAAIMSNALRRTALVNNLPVSARSWCHGSIATRIAFLHRTDRDGHSSADFDREMTHLNSVLLATGIATSIWTAALVVLGG